MQLNIGGAETHVVELAKELKRKGANVIVTSNGGVYVQELEEAGIRHYVVPLQNKNPINMAKAARLLRKIILDEKIDLVHSHARIPSFILGKLHKTMKFPFVTTAHWVFNTKYGLKYITDWGQKTVAVSEDIKSYLMENYHIPERDINVTINGIDTDKFSPETDITPACREFGLHADENIIVYVSRMDEDRSLVAKQLLEIMPKLDTRIEKLRLLIVGGGNDFETVKAKAETVNQALGRQAVVLTGPRTDINQLVAPAKLFVGVSRAALEAMAAEKPVIIAGNEGFIGLFTEDKLDVGIDTNFCCRGCARSTPELLLEEVSDFFARSEERQAMLGQYGREIIQKHYSVSRMTDDTIQIYDWVLEPEDEDEIMISGYYGFKNSGDDALLMAIIQDLKKYKPRANITVLSSNPKETQKLYGVRAINRLNVWKIQRHMKRSRLLISGGGTLIQDGTSTKSLWYYLAVISLALKNKLKVMLYANGIGPLTKTGNIEKTRRILNRVDLITLRDEASFEELKRIGVTQPQVELSVDPVFQLAPSPKEEGQAILRQSGADTERKMIGICIRKWTGLHDGFEATLAEFADYAKQKYGLFPVFIPMQISKDLEISRRIMQKMKAPSAIVAQRLNIHDMLSIVGQMHICIGMRLHSLIYSATQSVPLIGIVYDPKISGFMDYVHQNLYETLDGLSGAALKKLLDQCMGHYDEIKQDLDETLIQMKERAQINAQKAVALYEEGSVPR